MQALAKSLILLMTCTAFAPTPGVADVFKYRNASGEILLTDRPMRGLKLLKRYRMETGTVAPQPSVDALAAMRERQRALGPLIESAAIASQLQPELVHAVVRPVLALVALGDEAVLGRVHQENVLGDVFRIAPDDSRWKLEYALRRMEEEGCGVLVYLQKPAPRLENQLHLLEGRAPRLRTVDRGAIGLPPDLREFGIGAQILLDQGVRKLRLMTSSPSRIKGIEGYGLRVVETLAFPPRLQVVDANAKGQQA